MSLLINPKQNLPEDRQRVEFVVNKLNYVGEYIQSENIFLLTDEEITDFVFAFQIQGWKPLQN